MLPLFHGEHDPVSKTFIPYCQLIFGNIKSLRKKKLDCYCCIKFVNKNVMKGNDLGHYHQI
jgi:hypothetical protein